MKELFPSSGCTCRNEHMLSRLLCWGKGGDWLCLSFRELRGNQGRERKRQHWLLCFSSVPYYTSHENFFAHHSIYLKSIEVVKYLMCDLHMPKLLIKGSNPQQWFIQDYAYHCSLHLLAPLTNVLQSLSVFFVFPISC